MKNTQEIQIRKAARTVGWALAATIVVLSVVPPNLRPQSGAPHDLEHFVIYLATGLAFSLGYSRRQALLAILLVIFAGCVEILQLFVPGRHARLGDFIVDALGMCFGVAVVSFTGRPARLAAWHGRKSRSIKSD